MNSEIHPEDRLDLMAYRSSKIAPELLRRPDSNVKQKNRKLRLAAEIAEITARVESIMPQLITLRYSRLANWLKWQLAIDPMSYDLSNGIRACRLMIAGEEKQAIAIIDGINGIPDEDKKQDAPIRHTHETDTGGVELRPFVAARMEQSPLLGNGKKLLDNIGSGRK